MNIERNKDGALRIPDGAAQQLFTNRHIDYRPGCYVTVKQTSRVNLYTLFSKTGEVLDDFEDNLSTTFNSEMADDVDYDEYRESVSGLAKIMVTRAFMIFSILFVFGCVLLMYVIKDGGL